MYITTNLSQRFVIVRRVPAWVAGLGHKFDCEQLVVVHVERELDNAMCTMAQWLDDDVLVDKRSALRGRGEGLQTCCTDRLLELYTT